MKQAIVNPDDLRRFAQSLKRFNNTLTEQTTAIGGQLDSLANTWRDQEQKKFREKFEEHMRVLSRFIEENNEHIPYLLRKAERIDEYLQQR